MAYWLCSAYFPEGISQVAERPVGVEQPRGGPRPERDKLIIVFSAGHRLELKDLAPTPLPQALQAENEIRIVFFA